MKWFYKTTRRQDSYCNEVYNEENHDDPCCKRMNEMIEQGAIRFGETDCCSLNQIPSPCISVCSPYPEGACWDNFPIDFCPACGTPIESVCVGVYKEVWEKKRRTVTEDECTLVEVKE